MDVRWKIWDDSAHQALAARQKNSSKPGHFPISDLSEWFKIPVVGYNYAEGEETVPLIHFSVACGFTELTSYLLLRGVNRATLDEKQRTPLVTFSLLFFSFFSPFLVSFYLSSFLCSITLLPSVRDPTLRCCFVR